MAITYMAYYQGKRYTLPELRATTMWQGFDPEFADRLLAEMTVSIQEGHPVGVGGGIRQPPRQENLFKERHYIVSSGGCCYFEGKRWQIKSGQAHAAPPNRSYHEPVPPGNKALAADMIGDMNWQMNNCPRWGLVHFGRVNGEPWHLQPLEIPRARSDYNGKIHHPLPDKWPTDQIMPPPPPKPFVIVPDGTPPMRVTTPQRTGKDVADLQQIMVFWKWFSGTCDGAYGNQTAAGVRNMQTFFKTNFNPAIVVDGVYGEQSEAAYRAFANGVANMVA